MSLVLESARSDCETVYQQVIKSVLTSFRQLVELTCLDANSIDDLSSDLEKRWTDKLRQAQGEQVYKLLEKANANQTAVLRLPQTITNNPLPINFTQMNQNMDQSVFINPYETTDLFANSSKARKNSGFSDFLGMSIPQFDGPNDDKLKGKKGGSSLLALANAVKKQSNAVASKAPTTSAVVSSSTEVEQVQDTPVESTIGSKRTAPDQLPALPKPFPAVNNLTSRPSESNKTVALTRDSRQTVSVVDNDDEDLDDVELSDGEYLMPTKSDEMENLILAQYDKILRPSYKNVSRSKDPVKVAAARNQLKLTLTNVIMVVDGVDYVFGKMSGQLNEVSI